MLKPLSLVTLCVVAVVARESPNAAWVKEKFLNQQGRYSNNILEDALLDVPGLITKYGYPVEVHTVVTEDGYILEMHRIPHGRDNHNNPDEKREAVLVMHGLLSSSADFLTLGPGHALGYHLAEAGYDVWFGNARGNFYSRRHLTLDPEEKAFWRFSWDEIGNYDLPAFIDQILATTGLSKIHYIGHSQGGTSFLVLNSLRPEYNQKLISFQGLAPASFFTFNEHPIFQLLAPYEVLIETAVWTVSTGEILGRADIINLFKLVCSLSITELETLCRGDVNPNLIEEIINIVNIDGQYNLTMLPVFLGHSPAGASIRQVAHYGQVIRFDSFRRYNHPLPITNLAVYGRLTPPEYDLSNITVLTYLHYGMADMEVNYRDIYQLAANLPNVRRVRVNRMSRPSFNHYDFVFANDATEQAYNDIVASMRDAEMRHIARSFNF